jgi:peptide chain release factor subunit 1
MATTISRDLLRRLAEVHPDRGRVLSVFLNLDPSQFATPAARSSAITSVMTEAAHKAEAESDSLEHDERVALRGDVERVRGVLAGSGIGANGTRAVAVFACEPADLLEVVSLHHPLDSRAVIERTPFVEPLVLEGAAERWTVLLANRRSARLFTGIGQDLEETDRIEDDVHQQHDQGGWSQARYQRSVEKEKDDHLLHAAEVAFDLYKRQGFDRLLVGAPEELVGELEEKLHAYLRERIVGRVQLDVDNASLDEVRRCTAQKIEELATRTEREALDRLAEGVGRGGRGAAGLPDVLMALNEQRVDTLLVAPGFAAPGFRDRDTGVLYAERPDGANVEECQDIVEPAIEKALEQSATVLVVRHHDDLGPLGGIGAVLRF